MPLARAVGGRLERKSRTDRVFGEKGLNFVLTSVMKREIILAVGMWFGGWFCLDWPSLGLDRSIG